MSAACLLKSTASLIMKGHYILTWNHKEPGQAFAISDAAPGQLTASALKPLSTLAGIFVRSPSHT